MTESEIKLLEIAKEAIRLNPCVGACLGGSLLFVLKGIKIRREVQDIDIIVNELYEDDSPKVPKGFVFKGQGGCGSELNAIQFVNSEGIKLEFIHSKGEEKEECYGVMCGDIKMSLYAKRYYAKYDKNPTSKAKHELDIVYIKKHNPDLDLIDPYDGTPL